MANQHKFALFCLIFAFAVVTSYAETTETPEEPDSTTDEPDYLSSEEWEDLLNYWDEYEESGERVKRGAPSGQPNRNPLGQITNRLRGNGRFLQRGQQQRVPQDAPSYRGLDRHLQGGPGIIPPYRPGPLGPKQAEAMARQRQRDIRQRDLILQDLARVATFYQNKGISAKVAHERAKAENPLLVGEFFILQRRNPDFRFRF